MAREGLDDDLTERLLSRKAGGVHERRAYGIRYQTGPMVDRVLGHLRVAHAFEMGGEIFMPSGANLRDPKTVGLLFHERYHQWVSERTSRGSRQLFMSSDQDQGAEVSGEERKAEDYAAMVLDTATNISDGTAGESELNDLARDPGNPLSDTSTDSADDNVSSAKVAAALIGGTKDRDPMRGYFAMREQGFTHQAIVRDLARDIVDKLSRMSETQNFRTASSDTFGL